MKQRIVVLGFLAFVAGTTGNAQGHFHLAAHYAPVVYQDVVCTRYGDYITRVDYDGDYVGNNNWNHLGHPNKARRLPAFVYYAVIETGTHYFITYALFHPADDFHCHIASHENDLEGIIMTVRKDGTIYGSLRLVQLQAHHDYYQYVPPQTAGIADRQEDIDGTIIMDGTSHPRVYVEGGGHGIRSRDTGEAPSVVYRYASQAEDPDEVGYASTGYDLLSVFSEFWDQRDNCCGSGSLFDNRGAYSGHRGFSVSGIGRVFDGDDGSDDAASTPWHWVDNDDNPWRNGDWFMDPAGYQTWQFTWGEQFSTAYTHHAYLSSHIPDEIYNGHNGTTTLRHGPYETSRMVNVIVGNSLRVTSGRTVRVGKGAGLRADGLVRIEGGQQPTFLRRSDQADIGIINKGVILLKAGGAMKF